MDFGFSESPVPAVSHGAISRQVIGYAISRGLETSLAVEALRLSRRGNPDENAWMESLFKTWNYEEVYLFEYETVGDVMERISYFIKGVYSRKRLHSALVYLLSLRCR
jgi:hypothetical protein